MTMAKAKPTDDPDGVHVKFTGDTGALEGIARRGEIQTFTVRAKARKNEEADRKDGELRRSISFELISVVPGDIEKPPPPEKGLFAVPGQEGQDDDGTEV